MSAGNTAIDHSEALENARNMPNAETSHPGDLRVPQNGMADNYHQNSAADNYPKDDGGDNHVDRLAAARKGGVNETAKVAKDLASVATPVGALSLLKQINFLGDMPYIAAMGAAMLKDLLDFVAAPTIILSALFSALCTIFIFMMMLLVGSGGKKKVANNLLKKVAILGTGGIADSIPGIDFFPIESITVVAIYVMVLIERKNAEKN
jgi:hypothetical protein